MIYEKALKDAATVLAEIQVLAPAVDAIKTTGTSFIIVTNKDLTVDEIAAIAAYENHTLKEMK